MEAALNGPSGRTVLGPTPLRIGRAPDNTLVLNDPQSSSHHAEIAPGYSGNDYQITGLNSTNGTFVNEQRLTPNTPRPLKAGDVILIGNTHITYEVSESYTPTVPAGTPNYEPTVAAVPPELFTPPPQPVSPSPPAYGNFGTPPQQPPFTPPPAYSPPQPAHLQSQPPYPQAQPAYPQPAYPQPQPTYSPPSKKSHIGLIVAIIVILLLVVGGGTFYYFQVRSTPQKTLAAYCDGLKTSNAQEIYNQFDSAQQQKRSVNELQQELGVLHILDGIKDCRVSNVQENGSTATGVVTLTFGDGKTFSAIETLIQENGAWKMDKSQPNGSSI